MYRLPRFGASRLLLAGVCVSSLAAGSWAQTSVREVKVLGGKDTVEIEVEASDRLTPQTRVLTGPDRLVIDFPNTIPSNRLRNQSVNRGEVKDLRVGLFQSRPPVTRVVLDLKSPQSFQVFPYGRTVMIKVVGGAPENTDDASNQAGSKPGLIAANYTTRAEPVAVQAPPKLDVSFRNGLLAIRSNKATLSEVLSAVQQQTGAEIAIAAGAEQEQVVVNLGPAPAADVIASLLHGSAFNFLILSAANDPSRLDRVILSPRSEGAISAPLQQMRNDDVADDGAQPPPEQIPPPPPQPAPSPQPETKPADDNSPDQ